MVSTLGIILFASGDSILKSTPFVSQCHPVKTASKFQSFISKVHSQNV